MKVNDIVRETAETLREIPYLANVPVIEESKGDVSKTLEIKVAKSKVAVLVGWNGFTPKIQGDTALNGLVGSTTIVISIFEKPVVNRVSENAPLILDMAQTIANELHNCASEGMDAPLFLKRITPISELRMDKDTSVVTCDVEFETTTSL